MYVLPFDMASCAFVNHCRSGMLIRVFWSERQSWLHVYVTLITMVVSFGDTSDCRWRTWCGCPFFAIHDVAFCTGVSHVIACTSAVPPVDAVLRSTRRENMSWVAHPRRRRLARSAFPQSEPWGMVDHIDSFVILLWMCARNCVAGIYDYVCCRLCSGHKKYRALRLESGNFAWPSEAITRKTRIIEGNLVFYLNIVSDLGDIGWNSMSSALWLDMLTFIVLFRQWSTTQQMPNLCVPTRSPREQLSWSMLLLSASTTPPSTTPSWVSRKASQPAHKRLPLSTRPSPRVCWYGTNIMYTNFLYLRRRSWIIRA